MGQNQLTTPPPILGTAQIRLLEKLCHACAVSGDEGEVRKIVLDQIRPYVDELRVDAMGNVLAVRRGKDASRMKVMLAAHMDEVGFMLTSDDDSNEGIYRFEIVGGIDPRYLTGKVIQINRQNAKGVIGCKPIHLTSADERKNALTVEALRVDMGGSGGKAKIGDRGTFAPFFHRQGDRFYAKALDDRLGVATLIEILKQDFPHLDILAAFTVQEEVGLRGAQVAAYALNPDAALVLDCTHAYDLPLDSRDEFYPQENTRYNARLGHGPAIYLADRVTIYDPRWIAHLVQTAEETGIPYQFRQPGIGGTDAGAIHKQRTGIPTVSVSVPGRYLHTPITIASLNDWENTIKLVHAALLRLTPAVFLPER
ncbi:MAG: M42 family metallopeptidase [Chloroflexota bacterium]